MTVLRSEFSSLQLSIDSMTGLPTGIRSTTDEDAIVIQSALRIVAGGRDGRGPLGKIQYLDTKTHSEMKVTGKIASYLLRNGRCISVPVAIGGWQGRIHYVFKAEIPRLTVKFEWQPTAVAQVIRDITIDLEFRLPRPEQWRVNIGGAPIRADLPLSDLPGQMVVESWADYAAASGICLLCNQEQKTLVFWPRSFDDRGETLMETIPGGLKFRHSTGFASMPVANMVQHIDGIALDYVDKGWRALKADIACWFDDIGLYTPRDRPAWAARSTIFEAQIGTSIFAGGDMEYAPYIDVRALLDDVSRIHALGFDTLQIMPKQPYPGYNIADLYDITLTYGDCGLIKDLVSKCHSLGMKVILDVLLHGVIDQESFAAVVDGVKKGPWKDHLAANAEQISALKLSAADHRDLSWSRHILDFEQAWTANSDYRHEMADTYPDWFCRSTDNKIIGIYTKAIDQSHPEWHEYFCNAMKYLVEELNIDGFRLDAPHYNRIENWSERSRSRASLQQVGALLLLRKLRRTMHAINPDIMLYTEPNGALWREAVDLNYNYDETWLPEALFGTETDHAPSAVRTGRDLAAWMSLRNLTLPSGSITTHHIDSHDTFWWPLPGWKWRREQFGLDITKVLMQTFALCGGAYMMFVGGEKGIEEEIRKINHIRAMRPEIGLGLHDFMTDLSVPEDLFVVRHKSGESQSVVIINLGQNPVIWDAGRHLADQDWIDLLSSKRTGLEDISAIQVEPLLSKFLVPAGSLKAEIEEIGH